MSTRVDAVLDGVRLLSPKERREFVSRLSGLPGLKEDLYDLALFEERADEPMRDYTEFRKELLAEGRL